MCVTSCCIALCSWLAFQWSCINNYSKNWVYNIQRNRHKSCSIWCMLLFLKGVLKWKVNMVWKRMSFIVNAWNFLRNDVNKCTQKLSNLELKDVEKWFFYIFNPKILFFIARFYKVEDYNIWSDFIFLVFYKFLKPWIIWLVHFNSFLSTIWIKHVNLKLSKRSKARIIL